jgi:tRNA (cmo5U34)-methyltransferase
MKRGEAPMTVRTVFNQHTGHYYLPRKKLIPCFDDFYRMAIEAIPFASHEPFAVLDLDAGTGLMAEMVAAKYPAYRIDLMDIAEDMLTEAKKRLKLYQNSFRFITGDYSVMSVHHRYELVMSALSIHHLEAAAKRDLFGKIFAHLTTDGIFISADQVAGDTEIIDRIFRSSWNEAVLAKGARTAKLNAAFERMEEDRTSILSEHVRWLRQAGFAEVNCWYKNYSFAVVSSSKKIH